jgi:hypothetical protein
MDLRHRAWLELIFSVAPQGVPEIFTEAYQISELQLDLQFVIQVHWLFFRQADDARYLIH